MQAAQRGRGCVLLDMEDSGLDKATWQVLRSRPFRLVWVGETVSMLGDFSYQVAFPLLVLSLTRSPTTLASVLVATAVPRAACCCWWAGRSPTDSRRAR